MPDHRAPTSQCPLTKWPIVFHSHLDLTPRSSCVEPEIIYHKGSVGNDVFRELREVTARNYRFHFDFSELLTSKVVHESMNV